MQMALNFTHEMKRNYSSQIILMVAANFKQELAKARELMLLPIVFL